MSIQKKQFRYIRFEVISSLLSFLGIRSLVIFGLVIFAGCGLLESRTKPHIEEVPPYYQHDRFSSEARSYHDRESENMTNQVHIVRNREMERLTNAKEEEEKETKENQEKGESFWNKFKMNNKITDKNFLRSEEAARISANFDR